MYTHVDITILLLSLVCVLAFALWPKKKASRDDYWVNSRQTTTTFLAASLASSIVGAGTLFAVTAMGYKGGMAGALLGLANAIGVILFGLLVAPRINALGRVNGWYSITDPIKDRYNGKVVKMVGLVNLIAFFFFAAAQYSALARVLSVVFGLTWWVAVLSATAVLIFYVSFGGLRSDIRTDFVQIFFMAGGVTILLGALVLSPEFQLSSLLSLPTDYFTGFAYAGPAFLIGAMLLLPASVFVSLDMWQRAYAAGSPVIAKRSFVAGGLIMLAFFVAFSAIGTITYLMVPNIEPQSAILHAMSTALPVGVGGLVLAGLVAALMSTADSMLIAASVSIANDLSNRMLLARPHTISAILGILAAITAYAFPNVVQLLISAFSSLLVLAPLFIGFRWRRATPFAAQCAIVAGLFTTAVFLFIDPTIAFIPATLVSAAAYFGVTMLSTKQTMT